MYREIKSRVNTPNTLKMAGGHLQRPTQGVSTCSCRLYFIARSHLVRSLKELRKTRGIKPAHLRPVAYSEQDGGTELAERKEHETIADVLSRKSQKNIVLLVNEGTASSAEVFVSSLRDNGRVTLIGTRTFGKVRKH